MAGDDIAVEPAVHTREPMQRVEFWATNGIVRTLDAPPFRTIPKAAPGGYRIHVIAHTSGDTIASPRCTSATSASPTNFSAAVGE